ncbi:MAG: energy transducer TonB [Archangium sp.]
MAQPQFEKQDEPSGLIFAALLVASVLVHGVTFVAMPSTAPTREQNRVVEMDLYIPPPEPPKVEEEKPPEPEPPKLEIPKVKPPPQKLVAKAEAPPPKEDLPPPPNQDPPKEVPQEPVPIVIGVTMDSTTATGGFAVQVGNTTYGKASKTVTDPNAVKAYSAPKYAPPGSADTEPTISGEVKIDYPPEARKADIEGTVRMRVTIDENGVVTAVTVLSGPGYGLNEAARDAMKRFKWKPATKGGEAVGYTITYAYTFLLD